MDRTDLYPAFPLGWSTKLCSLGNYSLISSGEQQWEVLRAHPENNEPKQELHKMKNNQDFHRALWYSCLGISVLWGFFCKVISYEGNIRTCPTSWLSDPIFSAGGVGLDAAGLHQAQWWQISVQSYKSSHYKFLNGALFNVSNKWITWFHVSSWYLTVSKNRQFCFLINYCLNESFSHQNCTCKLNLFKKNPNQSLV